MSRQNAITRIYRKVDPDIWWYGASVAAAVAGFVVQAAWQGASQRGFGTLLVVAGLIVGAIRFLVGRLNRLAEAHGLTDAVGFPTSASSGLCAFAAELWEYEWKECRDRRESIKHGTYDVRGQEEMVQLLELMSRKARKQILAVDFIDLRRWFIEPTHTYLKDQLKRARRVKLTRIRVITSELQDREQRVLLREFMRLHDEAPGALLLLCNLDDIANLSVEFVPHTGALLIDFAEGDPACLVGRLGPSGFLESAHLYLRDTGYTQRIHYEFETLEKEIERRALNEKLRQALKRKRDPRFDASRAPSAEEAPAALGKPPHAPRAPRRHIKSK